MPDVQGVLDAVRSRRIFRSGDDGFDAFCRALSMNPADVVEVQMMVDLDSDPDYTRKPYFRVRLRGEAIERATEHLPNLEMEGGWSIEDGETYHRVGGLRMVVTMLGAQQRMAKAFPSISVETWTE